MWIISKVFIEFAIIWLLFCFGFFDLETCEILAPISPQPETEHASPALEDEISITRPSREVLRR